MRTKTTKSISKSKYASGVYVKKPTGGKKASLYLGRLWVCAARGDVDDVGDDEGACRPWGVVGRVEAWGRKGAPWLGAGRQEVEEEGEEEEGGTG